MTRYVIDASVILKSLMKESEIVQKKFEKISDEVNSGQVELISSKLLTTEVANGLRYGLKNAGECLEFFNEFLKLPIKTIVLTKIQSKKSIDLAYATNTTVYDASYHVLAKAHGATFLTCDKDYFRKAKKIGDIKLLD